MISDKLTTFLASTNLNTGAAGSYIIGDVVDLGDAGNRLHDVDDLYLVILCDEVVVSGGATNLTFSLVTDTDPTLATPVVIVAGPAVAKASFVDGYRYIAVALPKGAPYERYIGIQQTTATTAVTSGKVSAFLTRSINTWRAFADGLAAGA